MPVNVKICVLIQTLKRQRKPTFDIDECS